MEDEKEQAFAAPHPVKIGREHGSRDAAATPAASVADLRTLDELPPEKVTCLSSMSTDYVIEEWKRHDNDGERNEWKGQCLQFKDSR